MMNTIPQAINRTTTGAQRRRQMRIDVLDADFGQNRRQRGEQRGQQRIHAPHTGPFFPMGFYRSHYITKR